MRKEKQWKVEAKMRRKEGEVEMEEEVEVEENMEEEEVEMIKEEKKQLRS